MVALDADLPPYQQARRRRIVSAARRLLATRDFETIQIRDVAAEADVALGTLYRYFRSKDHLYGAVILEWGAPFGDDDPAWADLSPFDRLSQRIAKALDAFERHPEFFKIALMMQQSSDDYARELGERNSEQITRALSHDLERIPPEERSDYFDIIWGVLMHMLRKVVNGSASMGEARRVMALQLSALRTHLGYGREPAVAGPAPSVDARSAGAP